jgi:hypothetical protein
MQELEHTPAFKTLWQPEAIYQFGMSHVFGDEYLHSLVKLRGIYDTRTKAVAKATFRLGFEWGMKQDVVWSARDDK